ncbi:MAG: SGNH hydrolase domain-containing protein [Lawsonella clevelandensis]
MAQGERASRVYGDVNAKRSIALVGGSHAEHWLTALDTLGQREHFRVDVYFKMGCPLMISGMIDLPTNNKPYYSCLEWGAKSTNVSLRRSTTTSSAQPPAPPPSPV